MMMMMMMMITLIFHHSFTLLFQAGFHRSFHVPIPKLLPPPDVFMDAVAIWGFILLLYVCVERRL